MYIRNLIFLLFFLISSQAGATTYYVRTDGGTAAQCDGTHDAQQSGATDSGDAGSEPDCAYIHPFYATGWYGDEGNGAGDPTSGTATTTGDDIIISCNGSGDCTGVTFNMGYDAAWTGCNASWSYGCQMLPLVDGNSGNHSSMKGCSSTGCSSASKRPGFIAMGRTHSLLDLTSTDYADIEDIDVYDLATCGEGHATLSCGAADSAEASMRDGVKITGATNITLTDMKIYGARRFGIEGGSVTNFTRDNVELSYNAFGGWDWDSCTGAGTCGNSGNITARNGKTIYNGCVMTSVYGAIAAEGCYSQSQSGFGDGEGGGNTGAVFLYEDYDVSHNVADGLDMLYCNRGSYSGCTLTVRRSKFEGNGGNQVKGPNYLYIEDSKITDNCGYFYGQSFTCTSGTCGADFNHCRPAGHGAIVFAFRDSTGHPTFINNTITGNGDVMFLSEGESVCTTGTDSYVYSNLLIGGREFNDDTSINGAGGNDKVSIYYDSSVSCVSDFIENYNYCQGDFKEATPCPAANSTSSTSTTFTSLFNGTILQGPYTSPGYYTSADYADQLTIKVGAAVINAADESSTVTSLGADSVDFNSYARGASWDIGALEYGSTGGGGSSSTGSWGGSIKLQGSIKIQ